VLLQEKLGSDYSVINLSISCASNLLIRLQVDYAIEQSADFVILLGTSCTRDQGRAKEQSNNFDHIYQRFARIGEKDTHSDSRDLACYSMLSINNSCVFSESDQQILKEYHSRLFDLDLAIVHNKFLIESSLYTLVNNRIPFLFDQGGFENPIFGNVSKTYFNQFDAYRSEINMWTLSKGLPGETHKHILDPMIHGKIFQYYCQKILDFFQKNI
jgi:hypothetical protein